MGRNELLRLGVGALYSPSCRSLILHVYREPHQRANSVEILTGGVTVKLVRDTRYTAIHHPEQSLGGVVDLLKQHWQITLVQ